MFAVTLIAPEAWLFCPCIASLQNTWVFKLGKHFIPWTVDETKTYRAHSMECKACLPE